MKSILRVLKNKQIMKSIAWTIAILIFYRMMSYVTLPFINSKAMVSMASNKFVSLLNLFSGGGLQNFSIMSLGVSPFITAQIIVQLSSMDVVKATTEWSKQGDVGRQKLNQLTRKLTLVFAALQSVGVTYGLNTLSEMKLVKTPNLTVYCTLAVIMATGVFISTWLADLISEFGVGNGVSMIILGGIVSKLPSAWNSTYLFLKTSLKLNERTAKLPDVLSRLISFKYPIVSGITLLLIIGVVLLLAFIVWFSESERRVPIQYSRREMDTSDTAYLPLRINISGVVPVIFASSLITFPQTILMGMQKAQGSHKWFKIMNNVFSLNTIWGICLYTLLIVAFTFFYAYIQVNPERLSESLIKSGAYVIGVAPGEDTENHFRKVISELNYPGALFLGGISLIPLLLSIKFGIGGIFGIGGSSLLIITGVLMDVVRQIKGFSINNSYIGFKNNEAIIKSESNEFVKEMGERYVQDL